MIKTPWGLYALAKMQARGISGCAMEAALLVLLFQ